MREEILKESLDARKEIERRVTTELVRRDRNYKIGDELSMSPEGRILSFTPYQASIKTEYDADMVIRWYYSHLSRKIHSLETERSKVFKKIVQMTGVIEHMLEFEQVNYLIKEMTIPENEYRALCNSYSCGMFSKQERNHILNLCRRWKELSADEHYRLTKQEKRKFKKKRGGVKLEID